MQQKASDEGEHLVLHDRKGGCDPEGEGRFPVGPRPQPAPRWGVGADNQHQRRGRLQECDPGSHPAAMVMSGPGNAGRGGGLVQIPHGAIERLGRQPSHPTGGCEDLTSGTLALKQLGIPSGLRWGAGTSTQTRSTSCVTSSAGLPSCSTRRGVAGTNAGRSAGRRPPSREYICAATGSGGDSACLSGLALTSSSWSPQGREPRCPRRWIGRSRRWR